ncbi:MAG: sterol desaturase family protein [Nitrospirae bacterium]|nr:sterol desaturase family protein [Nitrospirota bacterium]
MSQALTLELKQRQFNAAMERYEKIGIYKIIGKTVSAVNVSLQCYLLYLVLPISIGLPLQILSFLAAYLAADLINGLVHMIMDSNDDYDSWAGPLIAVFHLHHKTPLYKKNNLLLVYFNESGSKIWLAGYLLIAAILIRATPIHPVLACIIVYIGILSSVAEVSHYCCHVSDSKTEQYLRYLGLLLSKKHHGLHHIADNVNYAFLNGFTDPLLNVVARKYSPGYKNTTDKHYALYIGSGTANR